MVAIELWRVIEREKSSQETVRVMCSSVGFGEIIIEPRSHIWFHDIPKQPKKEGGENEFGCGGWVKVVWGGIEHV